MTLFDKYGGRAFWAGAVDIFYGRLINDPQLSKFFVGKDVSKVKAMNTHLLECALGNSSEHFSVSVKRVHADMTIERPDFNKFLTLFTAVLRERGVSDSDLEEIGEVLMAFEDDVLRRS